MSIKELRKDLSNLKCSPFCTEWNISPSQMLRKECCEGSEIKHYRIQNVSLTDCKIVPNYSEDVKNVDSSNTARFMAPLSDEEIFDCGNQVDADLNSQGLAVNEIQEVFTKSWISLDLCKKQLNEVPGNIFTLHNIMYLYLANNQIAFLPDGFFEYFPLLRWLDLRYNCLTHLPSISLHGHDELRCLLIEGNAIRRLPLELGFMRKLHGLNIYNNPIEFPPSHIVKKGTREILKYLYDSYFQQNQGSNNVSSSCRFIEEDDKKDNLILEIHHNDQQEITQEVLSKRGGKMHKNFQQNRETQRKHDLTADEIILKAKYDLHNSALWNNHKNIEKILQQKKDQESLKKFQDEYKQRQEHNNDLNIEVPNVVATAPSGIASDSLKMLSHKIIERAPEERKPLPDVVSHKTKKELCKLRAIKIEELEKKIKSHYIKMHERRKQPPDSFIDEVAAMKKDLDKAMYLEGELEAHRQDLEYRFKAFTADISITNSPNTH